MVMLEEFDLHKRRPGSEIAPSEQLDKFVLHVNQNWDKYGWEANECLLRGSNCTV